MSAEPPAVMRNFTWTGWPCEFVPAQLPSNPFNRSNDLRASDWATTMVAERTTSAAATARLRRLLRNMLRTILRTGFPMAFMVSSEGIIVLASVVSRKLVDKVGARFPKQAGSLVAQAKYIGPSLRSG